METKALTSLWFPAEVPSEKILLVLHGRGDSAQQFSWIPDALQFKDINYLIVNAPDVYEDGFSWYDKPPHSLPGILRSRQLLDQLLEEIIAAGYRTEDLLVFGYSQGCLLTLEWGARVKHRLAACIGISGYCYDPEAIVRERNPESSDWPWLMTHGDEDERLPYDNTVRQVEVLKAGGLPIDFHTYQKPHKIDVWRELQMIKRYIRTTMKLA